MTPLKLGVPKGSLQDTTIELLGKAGWRVSTSSRSYFPTINDSEISCSLVRAQEMSRYVELGSPDCGLTGKDWTKENGSDVEVVCDLVYSKASFRPTRWVLAVAAESPWRIEGVRRVVGGHREPHSGDDTRARGVARVRLRLRESARTSRRRW